MIVTINEIRRVTFPSDSPGYLRVYISAIATDGVESKTEEFCIGRQVIGRRIVQDAQGRLKAIAGVFVDPATLDPSQPEPQWEYEAAIQDFRAEILEVFRRAFSDMFAGRHRESVDQTELRARLQTHFGGDSELPAMVRNMSQETI